MNLTPQAKFSSASKNIRKIDLSRITPVEPRNDPSNGCSENPNITTPKKQLKSNYRTLRSVGKPHITSRQDDRDERHSKQSGDQIDKHPLESASRRLNTVSGEQLDNCESQISGYFTVRERTPVNSHANSSESKFGKRSLIMNSKQDRVFPQQKFKSAVSQPTILSECESPTKKMSKQGMNYLKEASIVSNDSKSSNRLNMSANASGNSRSNGKIKGLFITNIDLVKATSTNSNDRKEHGVPQLVTASQCLKVINCHEQFNNQNPIQNSAEMRKSRETCRSSISQSFVFPPSNHSGRINAKENVLMPEMNEGTDEKVLSTSRTSKFERILSDKQKECTRLIIDNQNLISEVRSCHTRINSIQQNYGRMEAVAAAAHKTICELREETKRLREEIASNRALNQRELQQKENQFRGHIDRLLQDKNNHLERLQTQLKEKQSELQHTQRRSTEYSEDKKQEGIKLVEYYRKENKLLGLELFNSKKGFELLNNAHETLKSELKLAAQQIALLNNSLQIKEQQLTERENQLNEKTRQNQHDKNLLYDTLTKTIKGKEEEIYALRRELFIFNSEAEGELLMRSRSVENISLSRCQGVVEQRSIEEITFQLEERKVDIERLTALLKKETAEKEKVHNEKKILLTALMEKQKKEEEQKKHQNQQLKARSEEVERLSQQLKSRTSEASQLAGIVHTLEGKINRLDQLLSQTNEEMLKLRLEKLDWKYSTV